MPSPMAAAASAARPASAKGATRKPISVRVAAAGSPQDQAASLTRDIELLGTAKQLLVTDEDAPNDLAASSAARTDVVWGPPNERGERDIDAATIEALVEFATHRKQNSKLQVQLILTFSAFVSTVDFMRLIINRYCMKGSEAEMVPIRVQAFHMLKLWFHERPMDFAESPALDNALLGFIDGTLSELGLARTGLVLRRAYTEALDRFVQSKQTLQFGAKRGYQLPRDFDWRSLPDKTIAEQITLLELALFRAIPTHELLGKAWSAKDKAARAPHVLEMIAFFNGTSSWIITEIVRESSLKARAKLVARFIHLADQFQLLGNLSSLMAVIAALKTSEIKRLKRTWSKVSADDMALFESLLSMVSMQKNYSAMRKRVAAVPANGFCLPYMGMYLSDLTFLEDGNADMVGKLINFRKWRSVGAVIGLIERHQRLEFVRAVNITFCEYYKNAERWDEEACYRESKKLEAGKKE